MLFIYKILFWLTLVGSIFPGIVLSKTFYVISNEKGEDANIESPYKCSDKIGNGGNLVESRQRYHGKCEGAGLAPEIAGSQDYQKYLKFKTNPKYTGSIKTRTELAITDSYFPFKEQLYIGFRMMVPEEVDVTNEFFYLMQFWQCSPASPIAGIRMSRGFSHRINFMTRGDFREGVIANFDLIPNIWHRFIIMVDVNPRKGKGVFVVWKDGNGIPAESKQSYGYFNMNTCTEGKRPPQHFRIKFGIYKGNEFGKFFETRFDDIRIGNTYSSVKPW